MAQHRRRSLPRFFEAPLRTVPLVIVCERGSEVPDFQDQEEKLLFQIIRELGHSDRTKRQFEAKRVNRGKKVIRITGRKNLKVLAIYDKEYDDYYRFYIDRSRPEPEVVVDVMGVEHWGIIKRSTRMTAVLTITVEITPTTNLDQLNDDAKRFAASIKGIAEKPILQEEVVPELLKEQCEEHHVPFPEGIFRDVTNIHRYHDPKYKPGK